MKRFLLGLCVIIIAQVSEAQTRYLIKFKNKGTNPFSISNPSQYLSAKAIARRTLYSISIDSTDLPVTPRYVDSVRLAGTVTILNVSKWLNQVSIQTTDSAALTKINSFPFVQTVAPIAARINPGGNATTDKFKTGMNSKNCFSKIKIKNPSLSIIPSRSFNTAADFFNYGQSYNQVHIHNGEFLHNIGLRGQNMIISMLDAGFRSYTTLKAFDSVNANGQVLGTWDFVNREPSVIEDDSHGMQCFSTIAANIPGQFVGTAPKANFFLFRSEDAPTEYPVEEHNWVCATERADSSGTDVISSSLGYNTFDPPLDNASHTYADMNGNTTMAAISADLAAKKGILVINSAGNEGSNSWHFIVTPADGDSVIAVGAVNTSGVVAGFSSYGPSSDGQVKPDVASVGVATVVQFSNNVIGTSNGTSFSCPNMAGLTTCLWQGFPEYNNIKIIKALRQAGSIATAPNDRIGYGIPDVRKAVMNLLKEFATSNASVANCKTTINWSSKDVAAMKYEIERKLPGQSNYVKITERFGTGNIFGSRNYQYADTLINVQAGTISYRIRQVIDTSAAGLTGDYIDTVNVALSASCITTGIDPVNSGDEIKIMPNPARSQFTLQMTASAPISKLNILIINTKGQTVVKLNRNKPNGSFSFDIPISHIASGKYFVSIYNGQKLIVTKEFLKL